METHWRVAALFAEILRKVLVLLPGLATKQRDTTLEGSADLPHESHIVWRQKSSATVFLLFSLTSQGPRYPKYPKSCAFEKVEKFVAPFPAFSMSSAKTHPNLLDAIPVAL